MRSFVLHFGVLLFIIDVRINAFAIRKPYNASYIVPQDLSAEESLQLEVKHDLKRPNGIDGDISNKNNDLSTVNNVSVKDTMSSAVPQIATTTELIDRSSAKEASAEMEKIIKSQEPFLAQSLKISKSSIATNINTNLKPDQASDMDKSMTVTLENIKAKTVLSDITNSGTTSVVTDNTKVPTTNTVSQKTVQPTVSISEYSNDTNTNLPPWKRYTIETTTENFVYESTTDGDNTTQTIEINLQERIRPNFAEDVRSQSYLDEDAIKEVLLQETSLKNNEEISEQNREEIFNNTDTTFATIEPYNTEISIHDTESTFQTDVTSTDISVSGKSHKDKAKSTKVYAVNPNYKPMKKIEVQPPKSLVRDPDDNSWRNESISSLGIVFKPKNSSKPFTQVLKNKTETEWSNILSRDSKNDLPDLRERLEKIAQRRKSKKKKADVFGNIIYTDYEENNSSEEITNTESTDVTTTTISTEEVTTSTESTLSTLSIVTSPIISSTVTTDTITTTQSVETNKTEMTMTQPMTSTNNLNLSQSNVPKKIKFQPFTTEKGKKFFNVFDYYDSSDDDENEYVELAKLELKKFTVPLHKSETPLTTSSPQAYQYTKPLRQYLPDRQPTIQYFPPLNANQPKPNRFDNDFEKKVKFNMKKASPKRIVSLTNAPDTPLGKYHSRYPEEQSTIKPDHALFPVELRTMYKSNEFTRNLYQSTPPQITTEQNNGYGVVDHNGGFNRATYVIKNYRDFLEQAAKDYDYERDVDFAPYTEPPLRGLTMSDLIVQRKDGAKSNANFNYDYDAKFRKDVLQRFVDNFNHNEARYNTDFPVLYNNSVMHVNLAGNGEAAASSRAFLKGLYNPSDSKLGYARRAYPNDDPNCDNGTVELSPAYELHYYVPDQEEKEEVEPKPPGLR
ncbi:unnamed protein product, partial [Iphiclides podalirius]